MPKSYDLKKNNNDNPDLERLTDVLNHLPDWVPPRRTHTKRYLIEELRVPLLKALTQHGYSVARLVELLREHGVEIHPSTLRRYLGSIGHQRKARPVVQAQSIRPAGGNGYSAVSRPDTVPAPEPTDRSTAPAGAPTAPTRVGQPVPRPGSFIPDPEIPLSKL